MLKQAKHRLVCSLTSLFPSYSPIHLPPPPSSLTVLLSPFLLCITFLRPSSLPPSYPSYPVSTHLSIRLFIHSSIHPSFLSNLSFFPFFLPLPYFFPSLPPPLSFPPILPSKHPIYPPLPSSFQPSPLPPFPPHTHTLEPPSLRPLADTDTPTTGPSGGKGRGASLVTRRFLLPPARPGNSNQALATGLTSAA